MRDVYLSLGTVLACSSVEQAHASNYIIAAIYALFSVLNLYLYFNTKRGV